ncbi:MAG: hypothetical protein WD557_18245 [Dehalococcoidia bacterium]
MSALIYQVAQAGDFAIMPAYEGPWLLVSAEQKPHLPQGDDGEFDAEVVTSAEEVHGYLSAGAEVWSRDRDQLAGEG